MVLTNCLKHLHYQPSYTGGAKMAGREIQVIIVWLVLTAVFTLAGTFVPCRLPLAFDWIHFFENAHNVPAFYPPWARLVCRWLPWPLLIGLTLSTYAVAVMKRARSVASAVAAFVAMPLWWALFLGQLDGLAMLGVLGLPWLAPLALIKPQIAGFAILCRRKCLIVSIGFLLASLAIWGLWPLNLISYHTEHLDAVKWPQYVTLGLWGLPASILALWLVPGWNADKLMLAGSFITPALIPYQLLPLMPAIARLPWWLAWLVALTSWLPVMSNWWGRAGWWLAWVSVALLGAGLVRCNGLSRQ